MFVKRRGREAFLERRKRRESLLERRRGRKSLLERRRRRELFLERRRGITKDFLDIEVDYGRRGEIQRFRW